MQVLEEISRFVFVLILSFRLCRSCHLGFKHATYKARDRSFMSLNTVYPYRIRLKAHETTDQRLRPCFQIVHFHLTKDTSELLRPHERFCIAFACPHEGNNVS